MTTTADAEPNVLPFTSDEYRTVTDAQPRFARLGGHVSISAEAPDGSRSCLHHEPRKPA